MGEISGRFKAIIARVRFSLQETDTGTKGHALGASLRFPFPGTIFDYSSAVFGLDYDRLALRSATGAFCFAIPQLSSGQSIPAHPSIEAMTEGELRRCP